MFLSVWVVVVVMNVGEKQVELTDMITKDGKLKKKKAKRQMSPEEIKEKLRKLRGEIRKSCALPYFT